MILRKTLMNSARICALVALGAGVAAWGWDWDEGCECYPTEFVTRQAGDAVQVNKNVQMITPWPRYVKNRNLTFDGNRASIAMRRYQADQVIPPRNLAAQIDGGNNNNNFAPPVPPMEPQQ
jgi:hypothetical protein